MHVLKFNGRARFLLLTLLTLAAPAAAQIEEGDRFYAARAEGASGAVARSQPIDAAIGAYQRAIGSAPNDLEAHWKLLRALRFKGAHVVQTDQQKRAIYGEAREAGARALQVLERQLMARGIKNPSKASEAAVANVAKSIPGAGEIYLWNAVNWGEWALAYGKMAAARQGAADRIRRDATIAHLINPRMEGGAPSRVLGRLHHQTPRIPFLTGWADDREAVKFLEESLRIDPSNKLTMVFLAEAIEKRAPARGRQLLQRVIQEPPNPDYLIEDRTAILDATALIKRWPS
jgi:hypothetical protein